VHPLPTLVGTKLSSCQHRMKHLTTLPFELQLSTTYNKINHHNLSDDISDFWLFIPFEERHMSKWILWPRALKYPAFSISPEYSQLNHSTSTKWTNYWAKASQHLQTMTNDGLSTLLYGLLILKKKEAG
jgi:hypothetical protein